MIQRKANDHFGGEPGQEAQGSSLRETNYVVRSGAAAESRKQRASTPPPAKCPGLCDSGTKDRDAVREESSRQDAAGDRQDRAVSKGNRRWRGSTPGIAGGMIGTRCRAKLARRARHRLVRRRAKGQSLAMLGHCGPGRAGTVPFPMSNSAGNPLLAGAGRGPCCGRRLGRAGFCRAPRESGVLPPSPPRAKSEKLLREHPRAKGFGLFEGGDTTFGPRSPPSRKLHRGQTDTTGPPRPSHKIGRPPRRENPGGIQGLAQTANAGPDVQSRTRFRSGGLPAPGPKDAHGRGRQRTSRIVAGKSRFARGRSRR